VYYIAPELNATSDAVLIPYYEPQRLSRRADSDERERRTAKLFV
jgi:hypothetical protein